MNLQFQSTLKDLIVTLSWFRSVSLGFVSFRFVSLNIISHGCCITRPVIFQSLYDYIEWSRGVSPFWNTLLN